MPSAARVGDMHTGPTGSGGNTSQSVGPIVTGAATVLIDFMPAARMGDKAICDGATGQITNGSATVVVGGMPAARVGDSVDSDGAIAVGCPSVIVGD